MPGRYPGHLVGLAALGHSLRWGNCPSHAWRRHTVRMDFAPFLVLLGSLVEDSLVRILGMFGWKLLYV